MYFSGFASKSKEAQCEEFMDEVRNVEIEELLENGKFDLLFAFSESEYLLDEFW